MRALRYEWQRLRAARATWWITGIGLLLNAVAAVAAARLAHPASDPGAAALRRAVAAWVPAVPVPAVALAAGLLGAAALRQERGHPQLGPMLTVRHRRLRLVAAKLALAAVWAAGTAAVGLAVNSAAVAVATGRGPLADPAGLGGAHGAGPRIAVGLAAAAVAAAWLGLLGSALLGSTAAGVLLVVAVPMVVEPLLGAVLRRPALAGVSDASGYLPFGLGERWTFHGGLLSTVSAGADGLAGLGLPSGAAAFAPLAPALLLLLGCGAVLLVRRSL
ncbi:hypothetical protein BIV57_19730 [Mangrovactinospora gilvigrisea]|uniref:Uncharacterized protein n=1 Tax=Mangrovactinospora gilvigrisea TaxID=1428644 RepID=A0A1J7BAU9_9ACTN|nr:hypothetical protein [Mangrovactinospora gilvigrisea]OIV35779.1 hypothetical protein BIV57_19730 [Mangrovactinospora gilvigrisea]